MPKINPEAGSEDKKQKLKSRGFAITVQVKHGFDQAIAYFKSQEGKLTCGVAGQEVCPETKRDHLQCFIYFKNKINLTTVRGSMKGHITAIYASPQDNWDYCNKDSKILWTFGQRPEGAGARTDLAEIHTDLKNGMNIAAIADKHFDGFMKYHGAIEKYRVLHPQKRSGKPLVTIYWGPTGTGKSIRAYEPKDGVVPTAVEWDGRFLNGYAGQEHVVIDDFEPAGMTRKLFNNICDYYGCPISVKGTFYQWNAKTVTFTSNWDPKLWFVNCCPEDQIVDGWDPAIRRRIDNIVNLTEPHIWVPPPAPPPIAPPPNDDLPSGSPTLTRQDAKLETKDQDHKGWVEDIEVGRNRLKRRSKTLKRVIPPSPHVSDGDDEEHLPMSEDEQREFDICTKTVDNLACTEDLTQEWVS